MYMDDFQQFIMAPLVAFGIAGIICVIYYLIRDNFGKKKVKKSDIVLFGFFALTVALFVSYLWFVPNMVVGNVVREVVNKQSDNCREAYFDDGNEPTDEQCDFFQKILNGNYTNNQDGLIINGYTQN